MNEKKSNSIGGLYNRTSQKGLDYLSGFITINGKKENIVVFKSNKVTDRTPDYSIFISEPMGGGNGQKDNSTAEIPF